MKIKPWQLIVILVGLALGGFMISREIIRPDDVHLTMEYYLLDTSTGDLYFADWNKVQFSIPAAHPLSGEPCLVRAIEGDGKWLVVDRDLPLVQGRLKKLNLIVNPETGVLNRAPNKPTVYTVKQ